MSPNPAPPLIPDVAAAAGVSAATVDRVLNRRKGVSQRTIERVLDAAQALGYLSPEGRARIERAPPPNIVVLLPAGTNPYLTRLGQKVRALAARGGGDAPSVRCYFIDSFDAAALAAALRRHAPWADGIAFMAIDHPEVREAMTELAAAGKRLVTIVSDLPHPGRLGYVGLENMSAGRTAGLLMGGLMGGLIGARQGAVALIAGSRSYRAHTEREAGFHAVLKERFPGVEIVGVYEGHDSSHQNHQLTAALLAARPDLAGIYNVGGSSDGIARACREAGRERDLIFIGHGLTPDTRQMLIDGSMNVVIDSNPDTVLAAAIALIETPGRAAAVRMDIYMVENLPLDPR